MNRKNTILEIAKVMKQRRINELLKKYPGCSYNASIADFYKDAEVMLDKAEELGMKPTDKWNDVSWKGYIDSQPKDGEDLCFIGDSDDFEDVDF